MEARDVPGIGRDPRQRDHSQTKNRPLACTQGPEQETPPEPRKEEGRPSVRESYPWEDFPWEERCKEGQENGLSKVKGRWRWKKPSSY